MRSNDRRRSSDNIRDSTCFYSGEVGKHGFLMKSPPSERFSKQSSWKRRYFLLVKLSRNAYTLQYYSSQNLRNQCRGEIRLDTVICVCLGIKNRDKMAAVQKMFRCPLEQVISISTKQRDYYLIGDEEEQIQGWLEAIQQAREETWKAMEPQIEREEARLRSISLPVPSCSSDMFFSSARTLNKTEGPQVSAPRPHSDPYNYSSSTEPTTPTLPRYTEYLNHSKPEESKQLFEVNDSPDEGIYDTPSSILRCIYCTNEDGSAPGPSSYPKCTHRLNKIWQLDRDHEEPANFPASKHSDESEDDVGNNDKEGHYMLMRSIPQLVEDAFSNMDLTATASSSQDSLDSPIELNPPTDLGPADCCYEVLPVCDLGSDESRKCDGSPQTHAAPFTQRCSIERRNCKKIRGSPSLRRLFISEDPSQFKEENIYLPKEGLSTYLELVEVGERICVTQWNGPEHMTCPFHYGDHILAVNDIGIQSKEEVFRSIAMARSEKVIVTVLRVPNSDVLHAE